MAAFVVVVVSALVVMVGKAVAAAVVSKSVELCQLLVCIGACEDENHVDGRSDSVTTGAAVIGTGSVALLLLLRPDRPFPSGVVVARSFGELVVTSIDPIVDMSARFVIVSVGTGSGLMVAAVVAGGVVVVLVVEVGIVVVVSAALELSVEVDPLHRLGFTGTFTVVGSELVVVVVSAATVVVVVGVLVLGLVVELAS